VGLTEDGIFEKEAEPGGMGTDVPRTWSKMWNRCTIFLRFTVEHILGFNEQHSLDSVLMQSHN